MMTVELLTDNDVRAMRAYAEMIGDAPLVKLCSEALTTYRDGGKKQREAKGRLVELVNYLRLQPTTSQQAAGINKLRDALAEAVAHGYRLAQLECSSEDEARFQRLAKVLEELNEPYWYKRC